MKQIIEPQFDFSEMARRSLGAHWQRRSPEEQREFVKLFTERLETRYVDNVDSYYFTKPVELASFLDSVRQLL